MKKLLSKLATSFVACLALTFNAEANIDTVTVQNFQFNPSNFSICMGDTLRFVWVSGTHNVHITNPPTTPSSDLTTTGDMFQYIPPSAGSYSFQCDYHSSMMTGTFTVNAAPVVNLGADITQCGGTIMLDAGNAGSTFLWSTAATTQTISVSSSGTYSVTATNSCGTDPDTIVVTINTPPVVNLGADVTQCGGTKMLDAGNPGSAYLWSTGATAQTINVSSTGTYSVVVTDGNGCIGSDSIMVTFNTAPVVNLGPDNTYCGSAMLDAGNAGSSYMWSNSSTTQTINVTVSDTFYVDVTNICGTSSDTVIVTINSIPSVPITGSNSPVCAGNTLSLTASTIAGATYLWSGPNSFTSASQNPTIVSVTTAGAGVYSVMATVAGCISPAGTTSVTVNPPPSISTSGNTTICGGSSTTITASGGNIYAWAPGGQTTSSIVVTPSATTSYTVTGIDANGCSNMAAVTVTIGGGPSVTATSTPASCLTGNDGTATGNATGGTAPYTYLWTGGQTTQTATGLVPGNYTVTVTDASGCSSVASANIVSSGGAAQLQTIFTGGNGQDGNMFDITAITNIMVTSFEGNLDDATGGGAGGNMEIYYRAGTHVGNENNAGAWTFIGSAFVDPASTSVPTAIPIPVNITIPAGQSYGFYITGNNTGDDVDYTNGTNFGNPAAQDANIQILEGRGNIYPFGTAYPIAGPPDSRIWNGIVHYCSGPVGTEEENIISTMRGVNVFPNPFTSTASVFVVGADIHSLQMQLTDIFGRGVKALKPESSNFQLERSGLTAGIYFYRVSDDIGTVGTGKIVIE